ncbi:DUF6456 domain-containing protein [Planktotalea sp.]|uniref:DUF6456 domain-containing protein n=1 Tax=Planktotalea sp. TaxID=2029877 RepID=UPI003F6D87B6
MFRIVYQIETILNARLTVNDWVTISAEVVDNSLDNLLITGSEHVSDMSSNAQGTIPAWVPEPVQRYLTHTQAGLPIREVARRAGCHASTVLRQIRKIEVRRDDPLVDRALHSLSSNYFHGTPSFCAKETPNMSDIPKTKGFSNDVASMEQQTLRILRRLCEAGSVLAVAEGMDTAVVVRENQSGATNKTASVSAEFVAVLALNAWVECANPGRISRYKITAAGRAKLAELSEAGMTQSLKLGGHYGQKTSEDSQTRRVRYNTAESPVAALARRKDKDGAPFLDDTLVTAAERLREDFELAQLGPRVAQNWDNFLTAGADVNSPSSGSTGGAPSAARERVAKALRYLGPGLGDVALRCCCYLEGLESAEKRMGWSARSGKIVLRIALLRLRQFYETELGDVLIG